MEDLLRCAVPEGGFEIVKDLKGSPVPNEQVLENIKKSVFIEAPLFTKRAKRKGSFIFVAGGTTLLGFIDEIKRRNEEHEFICTSNNTYDFLVDKGIIPDACLIIDPKECVKTYINKPQKETTFYVGVVCHPEVAKRLLDAGMKVEKVLLAYGIEDESDIALQKTIYAVTGSGLSNFLVGGTMTGLRAMPFASSMGFGKIEYYGFDSCFSSELKLIYREDPEFESACNANDGRYYTDADTGADYAIANRENGGGVFYAYKKKRKENIQIATTPDGKRFITSPCFAHQAKQFIKWVERMEGKIEVKVYGDNLSSHLLKCHIDAKQRAIEKIGDKRWTNNYAAIQKEMHLRYEDYGTFMLTNIKSMSFEIVGKGVLALYTQLSRPIRILDYGCGNGQLSRSLKEMFNIVEVTNYDPFVSEFSKEPEGNFDMVVCLDVMEHIEMQCIKNTLKYIQDKATYMVVFVIALDEAKKELADGRNAHITLKNPYWWVGKLQERFIVVEAVQSAQEGNRAAVYAVCQSMEGRERFYDERDGNDRQVQETCQTKVA